MKCINHFNDAWVLLLTATPRRLDGRGLKKVADIMVHGPETRWLIDNKFLSPYRAFAPFTPDMSNSRIEQGDFKIEDAANVMDQPSITGDAVEHYKKICAGTRAIAFATNVQHSKNICEQFNGAGIPAQHIDGKMSKKERDEAIDLFRQDKIKVLTNCNIVSEGFDVPDMETAILLRPTKSISLYLQQVGRALRYKEGKVAFILDHAGNIFRHGMPCDKFNWYLSDKDKSNGKSERAAPIYQCKFCFFCFEDQFDICPNCEMEREDRKKVLQHKKGQLGEIFPGEVKNYRRASRDEIWSADTLEELLRIKTECNYKLGWVFQMCEEKGIYCDKKMLWRIYG